MAVKITVQARFPQLPEEVFDFVADMHNDPLWAPLVKDVQQLEGDGPGVGAVWSFQQRMGKRWYPAQTTMSTYERPTRLEWRADHKAMTYHSVVRIEPDGTGTRFIQSNDETFHGVPMVLRPLLPFVVRRALRRQMRRLRKALAKE